MTLHETLVDQFCVTFFSLHLKCDELKSCSSVIQQDCRFVENIPVKVEV